MQTIIPLMMNNVGRCISLQQDNGNHQCGYIIPFAIPARYNEPDWVRLINVKSDILVHTSKTLFDMVDINEVIFTDIDCVIHGKRYIIEYIKICSIVQFKFI